MFDVLATVAIHVSFKASGSALSQSSGLGLAVHKLVMHLQRTLSKLATGEPT